VLLVMTAAGRSTASCDCQRPIKVGYGRRSRWCTSPGILPPCLDGGGPDHWHRTICHSSRFTQGRGAQRHTANSAHAEK